MGALIEASEKVCELGSRKVPHSPLRVRWKRRKSLIQLMEREGLEPSTTLYKSISHGSKKGPNPL